MPNAATTTSPGTDRNARPGRLMSLNGGTSGALRRYAERTVSMAVTRSARTDRMMRRVHRWVWSDFDRRVRKLLAFAEVETDGGRDILRAAEVTPDPLLRRLYLEH